MDLALETSRLMKIVLLSTAYSVIFSLILVWMLERKERRYRVGKFTFAEGFFAAAPGLIAVYFLTMLVLLRRPDYAGAYTAALALCLAVFCLFRERGYRKARALLDLELREEIAGLREQLKKEPGNAACLERLSEIYERAGDRGLSLEAAREAARLNPSVGAAWRVKQLEDK